MAGRRATGLPLGWPARVRRTTPSTPRSPPPATGGRAARSVPLAREPALPRAPGLLGWPRVSRTWEARPMWSGGRPGPPARPGGIPRWPRWPEASSVVRGARPRRPRPGRPRGASTSLRAPRTRGRTRSRWPRPGARRRLARGAGELGKWVLAALPCVTTPSRGGEDEHLPSGSGQRQAGRRGSAFELGLSVGRKIARVRGMDQDRELWSKNHARADQGGELGRLGRGGHDDERGVAGRDRPQPGEAGRECPGRHVPNSGERLEHLVLGHHRGRHVRGGQADREPVPRQERADRCGGRHALLEGWSVARSDGGLTRVEEDDRRGSPRGLVLADHELVGPGDARPVDAAEVVALLVLAHRVKLLARSEQMPGERQPARAPKGGSRSGLQALDLGGHDQVVPLVEADPKLREGEGVGHVHRQRPERVSSTNLGNQRVRGALFAPRRDPRHDQPCVAAQGTRDPVLEQQERGPHGRLVLHLELDGDALARGDSLVGQTPPDRNAEPAPSCEQRGGERQDDQSDGHHVEDGRPGHPGGEPQGDAGGEHHRAPAGGHGQAFPVTGTATSLITSASTAPAVRPLITASAVTITRWDRTGRARPFTSSGITKSRSSAAARALAARRSMIDARGLAPRYTSGCTRVASTMSTMYRRTGGETCTCRAMSIMPRTPSASVTGPMSVSVDWTPWVARISASTSAEG